MGGESRRAGGVVRKWPGMGLPERREEEGHLSGREKPMGGEERGSAMWHTVNGEREKKKSCEWGLLMGVDHI